MGLLSDDNDIQTPKRCKHCESIHLSSELCTDVKEKEARYRVARILDLMKYEECKRVDAQNKKIMEFRETLLSGKK
jgi:hypothetical protein